MSYAGTIKKDDKIVATNTAVICNPGKTFTFRTNGTNPQGREVVSTMVFEKEESQRKPVRCRCALIL